MQIHWLDQKFEYTGEQLAPLFNYLEYGVLGDSIVGWVGACDVPDEHMIDGEDLRASSVIKGDEMLHFVLELFQFPLLSAIALQRLMGEILIEKISQKASEKPDLKRKGDDVYWGDKKLNISIATSSNTSSLIHFAFNLTNDGTPVSTCCLKDFGIEDSKGFAQEFMEAVKTEVEGIQRALMKVRSF